MPKTLPIKANDRPIRDGHFNQKENLEVRCRMMRNGAKKKSRALKFNFGAFFLADLFRPAFLGAFFLGGILLRADLTSP